MTIKFRKENVPHPYMKDSYITRWWYDAGTEFLPPVYAVREGYSWEVYDAEGDSYTRYLNYYSRLTSKKEVVKFIEEYDDNKRYEIKREEEEKERILKEYNDRVAKEKELTEKFLAPIPFNVEVKVDDELFVKEACASKASDVGDALSDLCPARIGKVVKVIELSNEDFDMFCKNSLSNDSMFEFLSDPEGNTMGGTFSEDPRLEGKEWIEVANNEELTKIYQETCKVIVHAITSPNRRNLFINTSGYSYARYLAFNQFDIEELGI